MRHPLSVLPMLLLVVIALVGAGDVEMSPISGDPENPRRHFRLRDAVHLGDQRAAEIYSIALPSMARGYAASKHPVAASYAAWSRVNRAPYVSATHGDHYINHYINDKATAYRRFEQAGKLPRGAVIAKDSFAVTGSGGILLGPLFVMEKMAPGFNPVSGDWRYSLITADGRLAGETHGVGSERVHYCIGCHLAREQHDHLYFVPSTWR